MFKKSVVVGTNSICARCIMLKKLTQNVILSGAKNLFLLFVLTTAYCLLPTARLYSAEDIKAKLSDSAGVSKFAVQDSNAANVVTIGSDGKTVITGTMTVAGNVGIGTTGPSQLLDVQGIANINEVRSGVIRDNTGVGVTYKNSGGSIIRRWYW